MIDTNIITDSLSNISSGGGYHIEWAKMWTNYVGWYIAGLIATFMYFWFVIRGGKAEEDTFKEFFAIRANQNKVYLHIALYTAFMLMWIYEGGGALWNLLAGIVASLFGLVNMDISKTVVDVTRQLDRAMPKGELNIFAILAGGGMTFFVRVVLPALWRKAKSFWGKKD